MKDRPLIVTNADMERLIRLVRALKYSLFRDQQQLDLLDQVLERAEVRPPSGVPSNVIGMNSCVRLRDFDTREKELYTLVFPEEANISRGLISVLAPLGIALLGRRQGDVIEAKVPGGIRKLRVQQVRCGSGVPRERMPKVRPMRRTSYAIRTQETAPAV